MAHSLPPRSVAHLRQATNPIDTVATGDRPVARVPVHRPAPAVAITPPHAGRKVNEPRPAPVREFYPLEPRTLAETGVEPAVIEGLILRLLLGLRSETGRRIADEIGLPLNLVRELLDSAKERKLVNYRGTTVVGDMIVELTEAGREKANDSRRFTAYVGPAPVPWAHYLQSLHHQSLRHCRPGPKDLERAFGDLQISDDLFDRIGPAVSSGRPLFLFGEPGNGKTSLAERMTRCFGGAVWIPQAVEIGGYIAKLYDPAIQAEAPIDASTLKARPDRRWVRVERPTVLAGGELTLDMLEMRFDPNTGIGETPVQLKANMGTLVIDDFGRGHTNPKDLLNRWILPLERGIDFLSLPDGRKFEAPFDCMLVFSTNLQPRDLADEAFLRRIPYKVHVGDPVEDEFEKLIEKTAQKLGVELPPRSVKYLVERHYRLDKRAMRFCHPRDLLQQVLHLCTYEGRPVVAGPAEWDRVVANYFGV